MYILFFLYFYESFYVMGFFIKKFIMYYYREQYIYRIIEIGLIAKKSKLHFFTTGAILCYKAGFIA